MNVEKENHFNFGSSLAYLMMALSHPLGAQILNLDLELLNVLICHIAASLS